MLKKEVASGSHGRVLIMDSIAKVAPEDVGCMVVSVSHLSACIGDSQDMWDHGVDSHVNAPARALGIAPGQSLSETLTRLTRE